MILKKLICAALCASLTAAIVPSAFAETLRDSIEEKTETFLSFENNFTDEKGGNTPKVVGTAPTFTTGQSGQGAVFRTGGGYLDFTNYIGSKTTLKNKSIAFSILTTKLHPEFDPAILSNSNWNKVDTAGFTFAYEYNVSGSYKARISNGSGKVDATRMTHLANKWQNYVLSFDDTNKKMLIYCDGELIKTLDYSSLGSGACENTKYTLKLGNDGTGSYPRNESVDYEFVIDNFMVTSSLLTDEEVAELNDMYPGPIVTRTIELKGINADNIPADGYANFNLYALGTVSDAVSSLEFDINYDTSLMTYDRTQFNNATVTEPEPGHLHIVTTKEISSNNINNYSSTRLTQLVFKTADISEKSEAVLAISNIHAKDSSGADAEGIEVTAEDPTAVICPQNEMDLNGDGVIGVGDVALADPSEKQEIASAAEIKPYKRAIAITIDGAGRVWSETNAPYNGQGITQSGAAIEGAGLENVRNNPYCMNLFNNEMAMSVSAVSMDPPISAQNYCSILHGVTFKKLPSAYQFTNDIANATLWPDYGLETPAYPSFLRAVNMASPSTKMYAYAEWTPITNGIIEQNSGAYVDYISGDYCFNALADYIKSGNMKNTTIAYMQSDVMDHYGHSYGYFTDGYYEELGKYEDFFPTLINALKEAGLYDDTLLVVNADHGGHNYWNTANNRMQGTHSTYSIEDDRGVFIAVGGQTVDKGAELSGGSNDDIAAVIFDGLRMDVPSTMTDSAQFDSSMFLSQEELSETGRDIERVTASENGNTLSLSLSNAKRTITAADIVIDTPFAVSDISVPEGTELLRNKSEDGKLYITLSFENTPESIADISFDEELNGHAVISEVMLSDNEGSEIYCDIENDTEQVKASEIWDRLSPSGEINYSGFDEITNAGFAFKVDKDVLDEASAEDIADISYDGGLQITKKAANERIDFETTFTSADEFASGLYRLDLDIEQINGAQMYISTKWRNFITLNWLADGTIDVNAGKATLSGYKNKRVKFSFILNYDEEYIDIYADGKLVVSKCALRDDASGSYSASKPMTFNINMTADGAAGSGMKLYSVTLDEYYSNAFKLTDSEGFVASAEPGSSVMAIADKSLYEDGAKIYLAAYNQDGTLESVKITNMSQYMNTSTDTVTVPENGSVKAMLWDKNMRPIALAD